MIRIELTKDYKDLARLSKVVQDLHCKLYPNDFKPFDQVKIEKKFEKMLSDSNGFAFVAREEEKAIGYLLCFVKLRKENAFQFEKIVLNISQISVALDYRNRGVAQQLIEQAEKLANKKDITCIHLDHWSQNLIASKFFINNGFEYYNHRMEKKLKN
jgi:ribosomal protein S18 acetylase RimI-like enzyme